MTSVTLAPAIAFSAAGVAMERNAFRAKSEKLRGPNGVEDEALLTICDVVYDGLVARNAHGRHEVHFRAKVTNGARQNYFDFDPEGRSVPPLGWRREKRYASKELEVQRQQPVPSDYWWTAIYLDAAERVSQP
ncbi:MAG: hypothetical protein ACTS5I_11890 [Rhodanobacter sp.]